MNITLRQLAHALALASHGSFRRAAREEHISQPAFSRSILNLEQALGAQLFERTGPRVTPTVFGEAVLRRAREITGSTRALSKELDRLKGLELDSLRVAMGTFPAELCAANALGELTRRRPDVRCTASVTNFRNVEKLVLQQAVDLGIADIGNLNQRDKLLVEPLGQHELVFFCRPGHPLVRRQRLTVADLEAYALAWPRIPSRLKSYRPYNSMLDEETGDLLPHIEVDQFSVMLAIVDASDTLGVAPPAQIEAKVRNGELFVLPIRAGWMTLEYGMISLRSVMPSPATILYKQLLQEFDAGIASRNRALADEFLANRPRQGKRH